jgi:hypothetical protein
MTRHYPVALALALSAAVLFAAPLLEAQKGKPAPSMPANALFRCPGAGCPAADATATPPVLTDAVTGDLFDVAYGPADGTSIDSSGEFALFLQPTGRRVWLDFQNGPAPCAGCRRTFSSIEITAGLSGAIHSNVIDPTTGLEASLGLRSIPLGATWPSRLKIAFNTVNTSGQTVQWAVRFNPRDYPTSDHIFATRTGAREWVLFATPAERAMLVSVCCRQRSYTNEGLYVMPFRIVVSEQ